MFVVMMCANYLCRPFSGFIIIMEASKLIWTRAVGVIISNIRKFCYIHAHSYRYKKSVKSWFYYHFLLHCNAIQMFQTQVLTTYEALIPCITNLQLLKIPSIVIHNYFTLQFLYFFFGGGGWRGGLSFNRTLESCAISIFRTV